MTERCQRAAENLHASEEEIEQIKERGRGKAVTEKISRTQTVRTFISILHLSPTQCSVPASFCVSLHAVTPLPNANDSGTLTVKKSCRGRLH